MRNKICQTNSSYNLFTLLVKSSTYYIKRIFVKYEPTVFPPKIADYSFYSRMKKIGSRKLYPLAIYKNSKGMRAVAKMNDSRIKDYNYYSLQNEITLYEIINKAIKRIGNKIPKEFSDMRIPKFLHKYEDENRIVSLIEFVEGKVAENANPHKKILIYFKVMEFFQFIGKHLTKSEKRRISKRTPLNYILLYPLLVIKAIMTHPGYALSVIRGIPIFLRSSPTIFSDSKTTLVHRDLHFNNIIISKDKIFLLDFQHCVYTEPLHELLTTLRYWWGGGKDECFGDLLLREIINRYSKREYFKILFQAFAINSATHGLTGARFSKKIIGGWINFLNFAINYNFEKY